MMESDRDSVENAAAAVVVVKKEEDAIKSTFPLVSHDSEPVLNVSHSGSSGSSSNNSSNSSSPKNQSASIIIKTEKIQNEPAAAASAGGGATRLVAGNETIVAKPLKSWQDCSHGFRLKTATSKGGTPGNPSQSMKFVIYNPKHSTVTKPAVNHQAASASGSASASVSSSNPQFNASALNLQNNQRLATPQANQQIRFHQFQHSSGQSTSASASSRAKRKQVKNACGKYSQCIFNVQYSISMYI